MYAACKVRVPDYCTGWARFFELSTDADSEISQTETQSHSVVRVTHIKHNRHCGVHITHTSQRESRIRPGEPGVLSKRTARVLIDAEGDGGLEVLYRVPVRRRQHEGLSRTEQHLARVRRRLRQDVALHPAGRRALLRLGALEREWSSTCIAVADPLAPIHSDQLRSCGCQIPALTSAARSSPRMSCPSTRNDSAYTPSLPRCTVRSSILT
eukprot:scaffold52681_cov69-Phaeocystis_antarctica.AAC.13